MKQRSLFFLAASLWVSFAIAQPGSIDRSFKTDFDMVSGSFETVGVQKSGKTIVGGQFEIRSLSGQKILHLARLNKNGSLDIPFVKGSGFDGQVHKIAVQKDDKILVGGGIKQVNGMSQVSLVRLNPDGTLDPSFNFSHISHAVLDVAIQPDNKILVTGFNQNLKSVLYRIHPNGTLDPTFSEIMLPNSNYFKIIKVLRNDKIMFYSNNNLENSPHVGLIGSTGTIDTSFHLEKDVLLKWITGIELQSDGKIILGGGFSIFENDAYPFSIRLHPDGTLDKTYTVSGELYNTDYFNLTSICLQSDDKILAGGIFNGFNKSKTTSLIRFNAHGEYDNQFNMEYYDGDKLTGIFPYGGGKYLLTGDFVDSQALGNRSIQRIHLNWQPGPFEFTISANPNHGVFRVDANRFVQQITITDATGREILKLNPYASNFNVDISDQRYGIYFLHVVWDKGSAIQKLLKL